MAAGLALLLTGACAHEEGLVPAPQAALTSGAPRLAYDRANGVTVFVDGDAWRGEPRDLEKVMAPVWVTVRNGSSQPVRLMYRDFWIHLPNGLRVQPLPPLAIQQTPGPERTRAIPSPAFRYRGFYLAPHYRYFYPGLPAWHRPFLYDPLFYDTLYARWRISLPTDDMLRAALPEGVIEPTGEVSGFLYFPDIPRDAQGTFTFQASLPQVPAGTNVAKVDIPLTTR
jgi:hypothetical protein